VDVALYLGQNWSRQRKLRLKGMPRKSYRVNNGQNINAEAISDFTFDDAMAMVGCELVTA